MKIPEDDLHQTEYIWDDLVEQHLQFASKNVWKSDEDPSLLLKLVKSNPMTEGIFDIVAKVK